MRINFLLIIIVCLVSAFLYRRISVLQEKDLDFFYARLDDENGSAASVIERRIQSDKRRTLKLLAIAIVIIVWQGIWSPTNRFNTEKQLGEEQKSVYINSYDSGWSDQCEALFGRLGGIDSPVYGEKLSLTYPQCMALRTNGYGLEAFNQNIGGYIRESSTYDMREKGHNQANRDVLSIIFKLSPYWCYGVDCLSGKDFGILRPQA